MSILDVYGANVDLTGISGSAIEWDYLQLQDLTALKPWRNQ